MKLEHSDLCASLFALSAALALSACVSMTSAPVEERSRASSDFAQIASPGYHIVKKGDTLYSIALEYGQDYRDIAAWNYLTDPNRISIGQSLRIWPPGASSASGGGAVASTAPVSGDAPVEQRMLSGSPEASTTTASINSTYVKREPMGNKETYSDARYETLKNASSGDSVRQTAPSAPVASATQTTVVPTSSTPVSAPAPIPEQASSAGVGGIIWDWPADGKVIGGFAQSKGLEISGKAGDSIRAAADGKVVYTGDSLRGYGNLVIIKHNNSYLTAYAHNRKILVKEGQTVKRGAKIAEMGNSDSDVVKLHFEVRMQGTPVEPLNYLPKK